MRSISILVAASLYLSSRFSFELFQFNRNIVVLPIATTCMMFVAGKLSSADSTFIMVVLSGIFGLAFYLMIAWLFARQLVNRFFDILTIQKAAPKLLIDALGTLLAVIVGLSVLAAYHPLLLVFDLFLILIILVILFLPLRRGQSTAIDESSAKYDVAAWLEEIARVPRAFRNGGSQEWIFEKSDERILGDKDFVDQLLPVVEEQMEHRNLLISIGYNLKMIAERMCSVMAFEPSEI